MKYVHVHFPRIGSAILLLFVLAVSTNATPPPPPPDLDNELEFATFAGVIECLEQGPRVSRFRAVESWYGEAEGKFWLVGGVPGQRYAVVMGPYIAHTDATGAVASHVMNSAVGAVWIPQWPSPLADQFENSRMYAIDADGGFFGERPYDKFDTVDEMKELICSFFAEVQSGKRVRKPITKVHSVKLDYRDSGETLRFHRTNFKKGFTKLSWDEMESWVSSYLVLCDADPGYVCRLLKNGRFLELSEHSRGPSYVLTDVFCQTRPVDQVKFLEALSESDDTMTSMIATMHLYFRSPDVWHKTLEPRTSSTDAIGNWAALILACDGDKDFVDEALRICVYDRKSDLSDIAQRNLRYWLLSLLANTAFAAGIDFPEVDVYLNLGASEMVKWWEEYGDRVDLVPLTRVPIDPERVYERLGVAGGEGLGYWGLY